MVRTLSYHGPYPDVLAQCAEQKEKERRLRAADVALQGAFPEMDPYVGHPADPQKGGDGGGKLLEPIQAYSSGMLGRLIPFSTTLTTRQRLLCKSPPSTTSASSRVFLPSQAATNTSIASEE